MARILEELATYLTKAGWQVVPITCYDTVPARIAESDMGAFRKGVDAALFASPSQVRNFWSSLGEEARGILKRALLLPIGPTTARALEELGLEPGPLPEETTAQGLVNVLVDHFC